MKRKWINALVGIAVLGVLLAVSFFAGEDGKNSSAEKAYNEEKSGASYITESIEKEKPVPSVKKEDTALEKTEPEIPEKTDAEEQAVVETSENKEEIQVSETVPSDYDETELFMQNSGKYDDGRVYVPEGRPSPIEPEAVVISDKEHICTLSVRCDTIFPNKDRLNADKLAVLPADGVVFAEQTVTFYEGESVFNLLLREMKKNKIHFEFEKTPVYNSAYIEGINNIYELDCGELSGWMYRVNEWFPTYGCSRYQLKEGDRVELLYTCDLGREFK